MLSLVHFTILALHFYKTSQKVEEDKNESLSNFNESLNTELKEFNYEEDCTMLVS